MNSTVLDFYESTGGSGKLHESTYVKPWYIFNVENVQKTKEKSR